MPQPPDHQAGINALPKWDPNNLAKGYAYDWRQPYDPKDYAKFKEARAAADKARQARSERDLKQALKDAAQAVRDKLDSELEKSGAKRAKTPPPEWDGASTCFADLEYVPGGVWATFHRGGAITYFYVLSKAEAADWFDDESAGGYFNDNVR
jgi:hypothetical protein